MRKTLLCGALLFVLFLWSCGQSPTSEDMDGSYGGKQSQPVDALGPAGQEGQVPPAFKDQSGLAGEYNREKTTANEVDKSLGNADASATETSAQTGKSDDERQAQERKRVYTSTNEIEVADVENTKDKIREYVVSLGGIVDTISDNFMSVRVPSPKFNEAVKWTLALGHVIKNEIENYDVTDYYSDVDARLKLAQQTRTRLNQLLEITTDVEQRVEILREIRRLSEEIESLNQTLRIIDDAVAFSRIDITLSQIAEGSQGQNQAFFPWIAALSPATQSVTSSQEVLAVDLGENFAKIGNGRPFYAESPDGIKVKIGSVRNNPKGDTAFWAKALRFYMASRYAKVEDLAPGTNLKGLRLTSFDVVPFVYEVLVQVRGDNIVVCEVYFPTLEQFTKSGASIEAAFAKAAGGSGS